MHPFDNLLQIAKPQKLLQSTMSLLDWDQETYMPKEGIHLRSEQIEYLSSLLHHAKTSSKFLKALEKLISIESGEILGEHLDASQQAAVREWRNDYLKAVKLPNDFVKSFAKTKSEASNAWIKAKNENDFNAFAPHLEKIVSHCRQQAEYLGYEAHPYDALLDLYEPEMTIKKLTPIFDTLKPFLTNLTAKLKDQKHDESFLYGSFSEKDQMDFSRNILEWMGLDFDKCRLDRSGHPFCTSASPFDVRMTTHTETSNLMGNISAVMHEGGHALYEAGLPMKYLGSPLCEALSLGLHESQSKWWENHIGLSLPFWQFTFPKLQKTFPDSLKSVSLETFYRTLNRVTPSLIRVHADEVTYSLHIILRFELEVALIEGKLDIKDVPEAWNAKMVEFLGMQPKTDREGCLQDIHWSLGILGYFPTYALGNLYAAQFFDTFSKKFSDWEEKVAQGDLIFIKDFLNENIHKYGRQYSISELLTRITGADLDAKYFMDYLGKKFKA